MSIASVQADHYSIPLPVALSDSTHGTMTRFELITVRLRDGDGAEGVGYTYTVGAGGAAIAALIDARSAPRAARCATPTASRRSGSACGGRCTTAGAAARGLRSRPCDIALWDLKARRCGRRCGGCSAVSIRRCRATPAASTWTSRSTRCCARPTTTSRKGFRAIKMKVGRPRLSEDVERVRAMRAHLGADFPLMADANMRWSVDEAIRAARALPADATCLAGGADHPRRRRRPRAHRARRRRADRHRREPAHAATSSRR